MNWFVIGVLLLVIVILFVYALNLRVRLREAMRNNYRDERGRFTSAPKE